MFSRTTTKSAPAAIDPGHAGEGAQVDVEVELEAEAEQQAALEGPGRDRGVADRRPDGTEEDGVEAPQLVQGLVGQDVAVAQVAGGAEVEVGGVEVDARPRRRP